MPYSPLKDSMTNPDVVLVIGDLGPGGTQRVVMTLANAWHETGTTVAIVTLSAPESDFFRPHSGIPRHAIGQTGESGSVLQAMLSNIRRIFALRRILKDMGSTTVVAFIGSTNVLTVIAALGLATRVVISERNDPGKQPVGLAWRVLRRLFYPMADLVTANSHAAMEYLKRFVPIRKLALVPNPVVFENRTTAADIPETTILTVASFSHQKAHDILLQAFAKISNAASEWRLVLIGEGKSEAELRTLADQLGIGPRIDWLGKVPDPYPYYRAAGIFTLPSRFEGTANVVLEAMSCGTPVVVTDSSSGPSQLVENDASGLVVPVDDVSSLASALLELINDPSKRRRLASEGLNRVRSCSVENVLVIWNDLLDLSQAPRPSRAVW